MRLIKMFGLAVIAAVVAMAFVGATSASANGSTALCEDHTGLACDDADTDADEDTGEGADPPGDSVTVSMLGSGTLLSSLVNVLCLHVHGTGLALALGNPQKVHITLLHFLNCGTKSAHNNCDVVVLELPLANLLKTGLDAGTITGTNGLTLVECQNIDIFGIDIHCVYDGAGLAFSVGAQHLTADDTQVDKVSGDLCPDESFLDGLLVTTANRYVLA